MLSETPASAPDGQPYRLLAPRSNVGVVITLMDWGAALLSICIPLPSGSVREVLFGCISSECCQGQTAFPGVSIGRYVNRVVNSRYTSNGETMTLSPSQGVNQLHGGPGGSGRRRWQIVNQNDRWVLFALSPDDGDQGSLGNLGVTVQYRLTGDNRISTTYRAVVDKPYPANMTNHVYFNLGGEQSDVHNHKLRTLVEEYLSVDKGGIPHDDPKSIVGISLDFHNVKVIASEFLADGDQRRVKDYDHVLSLQAKGDGKGAAAYVWSADEKLQLKVYITTPALQFYSGNFLGGTPSRGTEPYTDWQGLALESEFLPGSPNHPEWPRPDCFLRPDEEYSSLTEYQFIAR